MLARDFESTVDEVLSEAKKLLVAKGKDYAERTDELGNFKKDGEIGLTWFQAWAGRARKHFSSIWLAIKNSPNRPFCETEKIENRALDAICYLVLFIALIKEADNEQ